VDNGSSSQTVATLSQWRNGLDHNRVELICLKDNLGFAGGMNRGIEICKSNHEPDYLWLLNNDLYVSPDAALALFEAAEHRREVAIWGPTVLAGDEKTVQCAGGCRYFPIIGYAREAYAGVSVSELAKLPPPRIDYIFGAAIFLRAEFVNRIGGLDERYFLYYEEPELARNLLPDERMAWCREAVVVHRGAGSSNVAGIPQDKIRQAALSALVYTRRHYPLFLPSVFLARLLGVSLRGLINLDFRPSLAVLSALVEFFRSR
jgi:GT2 family glycosyltransferase